MKSIRKIAVVLMTVVALVVAAIPACAENRLEKIMREGKITVCTEPYYAPMEFIDNTKTGIESFRGSDIDLAHYIADRLGVTLEIIPLTFDGVLVGIQQGKYDLAISALAWTELRAKYLEFSAPYITEDNSEHGLLIRKTDLDKYKKFADFDGKTIGFQSGTLQEQLALKQVPNLVPRAYDNIQNAVLALDAGKIEAVAASVDNGNMFAAAHPALCIMPTQYFVLGQTYTCIAATKGEVELIAKVNEIIAEVLEKDIYTQWYKAAIEEASKLGIK